MRTITSTQIINTLTKNLESKQASYESILNKLIQSKYPAQTLKWNGDLINLAAGISVYKGFLINIQKYISAGMSESETIKFFKEDMLRELTEVTDVMNRSTSIMHNLVEDAEKCLIKELFNEVGFRFYNQ